MSTKTPCIKGRALRRYIHLSLTLFFYTLHANVSFAGDGVLDTTISNYIAKMALSLILLIVAGLLIMKYVPGRFKAAANGRIKHIGTMPVGREAVHVIQAGPDVIAVLVAKTGSTVIGRWTLDEWEMRTDSADFHTAEAPRRDPR